MLPINSSYKYYFYVQPTDMRKGFNGLSGLVRNELDRDPMSGDAFIFVNRRRNKLKLLIWDRTGFLIYYKQLETGTFELPNTTNSNGEYLVNWEELVMILEGIALQSIERRKRYKVA